MAEERTFQIQLEGLIQLLAQNLYADPDVFLREMIQNAHDSIKRRAELARDRAEAEPPSPRIQVTADPATQTIHIYDNGCGLTEEEIDSYLSTIGRSGTDELRQRIVAADRGRTVELIGQFGIGLLSAFIVAKRVTVVTRAADQPALQWQCEGGRNYTVEPAERQQVGTTVTLDLSAGHSGYLDRKRLETIIRTYADFLGVPVFVNDDAEPTNAVTAPWHRSYSSDHERGVAYREFWEKKFLSEYSLHVFAVDESVEWDDISQPDGKGRGRVRGVLAVTDRHVPDVNMRGTVDLYINRMFISAGNREVLPPWARFLQGVVECNQLTPNAARDNVVRNAALAAVQRALGLLVVSELTDLSQRNHQRFVEIMRWHSYHLLAMSVQDEYEDFFRSVADLMPLESDQGPMTVAEYLKTAPRRTDDAYLVYYITERGSANQFFLLASARSIRVFNCSEPFAERFLERYAKIWPNRVHLSRLDVAGSATIFEPLTDDEAEHFADLQIAYTSVFPDSRSTAKVSKFRPAELPAVLTESRDGRNRREMRQVADNLAMPDSIRGMIREYLSGEREPLTLHLNAENPTIRKLASRSNLRDEVSRQALASLYNNALMLLARALTPESVQTMFMQYNQVIELMLSLAEDRTAFERMLNARQTELDELQTTSTSDNGLDPFVSCFVAMSFTDQRSQEIFDSVRSILEDSPYFWRVVRADDSVEAPGIWTNLKTKLLRAHCYIAILSEVVSPNVMIEIGRMEALERPLLILRDDAAPEPPVDLRGLLYETVHTTGADQVHEVRDILARQAMLQVLNGRDRFLSETVLLRAGLNARYAKEISRQFPAWQGFLSTDSYVIASAVGCPRPLVDAAKETLGSIPQLES